MRDRSRNTATASREESKEINVSALLSSYLLIMSTYVLMSCFPLVKRNDKPEGKGVQLMLAVQISFSGQSTAEGKE